MGSQCATSLLQHFSTARRKASAFKPGLSASTLLVALVSGGCTCSACKEVRQTKGGHESKDLPRIICTVRTFAVMRIKLDFLFRHRTVYPKEEAAILLGYMLLFKSTWGKAKELGFCGFSRFLLRPCIIQGAESGILNFD